MKSIESRVIEGTLKEVEDMIKSGMIQLSKSEYIEMLDTFGYKMGPKYMELRYVNNLNEGRIWNEFTFDIVEKDTRLSFAHVDARKDLNFKKLQDMRMNYFVFENNVIWSP